MEMGDDPPLERGIQVDQHIAATDQVHTREGRVDGQIVPGENAKIPDRGTDAVAPVDFAKESPEPIR